MIILLILEFFLFFIFSSWCNTVLACRGQLVFISCLSSTCSSITPVCLTLVLLTHLTGCDRQTAGALTGPGPTCLRTRGPGWRGPSRPRHLWPAVYKARSVWKRINVSVSVWWAETEPDTCRSDPEPPTRQHPGPLGVLGFTKVVRTHWRPLQHFRFRRNCAKVPIQA